MPKFVVYVLVGCVSSTIDLVSLWFLIGLNTPQWLAVTLAFMAGFVLNAWGHALFTFEAPLTKHTGTRFAAVVGINYLLTLLIIETLKAFSLSLIAAKVLALPIIAASGFLLSKYWAFKLQSQELS
jgi:putative flippase GtrA